MKFLIEKGQIIFCLYYLLKIMVNKSKKKTITISPILTYINYDTNRNSISSSSSNDSINDYKNNSRFYLKMSKSSNSDFDDFDYEYY